MPTDYSDWDNSEEEEQENKENKEKQEKEEEQEKEEQEGKDKGVEDKDSFLCHESSIILYLHYNYIEFADNYN